MSFIEINIAIEIAKENIKYKKKYLIKKINKKIIKQTKFAIDNNIKTAYIAIDDSKKYFNDIFDTMFLDAYNTPTEFNKSCEKLGYRISYSHPYEDGEKAEVRIVWEIKK